VRLVVATDENGAMGCTYRSLPWAFKASGQLAAISAVVASHPVIVGRTSAAMGDDALALARRMIVLSRASRRYDYHHGRRVQVDTRPKGIPQSAEIAHSVDEVLSLCRNETLIYVVGGQSTFEAFLPYASAIHRFVLSGTLPFAGRTGQTTYFPPLPSGPSLVTHHVAETHDGPGYRVETYITHPSINPPVAGMSSMRRAVAIKTEPYRYPSKPCRTNQKTLFGDVRNSQADDGTIQRRASVWLAETGTSTPTMISVRGRALCDQQQQVDGDQQGLIEKIRDLTLAEHHETLDAIDLEQIAIRDYYDSLLKGHTTNTQTRGAETGARLQDKGKQKVVAAADDKSDPRGSRDRPSLFS
jgi:dihydrofolate reductase